MSVPRRGQSGAMRCAELPPLMYDVPCRRLQWKSCLAGVYASDLLSGRRRSGGHGQRPHLTWIRYPKHVARGRCTGARYTPTRTRDTGGRSINADTGARHMCREIHGAIGARYTGAKDNGITGAIYTGANDDSIAGAKCGASQAPDTRARNTWHRGREMHGREMHGIAGARYTGAKYTATLAHRREMHGITGAKYTASRARDTRARNTWHHERDIQGSEIYSDKGARYTGAKYMAPRTRDPQARNAQRHGREIHGREKCTATQARDTRARDTPPARTQCANMDTNSANHIEPL